MFEIPKIDGHVEIEISTQTLAKVFICAVAIMIAWLIIKSLKG